MRRGMGGRVKTAAVGTVGRRKAGDCCAQQLSPPLCRSLFLLAVPLPWPARCGADGQHQAGRTHVARAAERNPRSLPTQTAELERQAGLNRTRHPTVVDGPTNHKLIRTHGINDSDTDTFIGCRVSHKKAWGKTNAGWEVLYPFFVCTSAHRCGVFFIYADVCSFVLCDGKKSVSLLGLASSVLIPIAPPSIQLWTHNRHNLYVCE